MKNKIRVCFFGAYDRDYSSNKLVLKGLSLNDVDVIEVNAHVKVTRLDKKGDMTPWKLIKRVVKKYKLVTEVMKNIKGIRTSQAIYVGYPGHFDVIPAFIVAKVFGKKLIFNPLVIFYTGFVEEQGILKKDSLLGKVLKTGEIIIYNICDLILADTPFQKEHLVKVFGLDPQKIKILSIGADDETYKYKERKPQDDEVTIVYYGLYAPIHSVETIIRAAALCKDPKIKFIMVGNGNTCEKDFELAKSLKLQNMVFYKNMTEDNALKTLQEADIFMGLFAKHGTVDRVVPNKVFQGIALGKAVITANAPAIRSVFDDQRNIYLVKPQDPKGLSQAITDLSENTVKRMHIAQEGYRLYKEKFTPKALGKILSNYIASLVN